VEFKLATPEGKDMDLDAEFIVENCSTEKFRGLLNEYWRQDAQFDPVKFVEFALDKGLGIMQIEYDEIFQWGGEQA
jgi:hypothetical protein